MRKKLFLMLFMFFLVSTITVQAQVPINVKVSIPKYDITINKVLIDNEHLKYPLLNYNYITYFPMTWDFCQALGLESSWDEENGLKIIKGTCNTEVKQDLTSNNDLNINYNATISDDKIIVNDKIINNNEEEYPILNFRDITYFPITWRFSVDEFSWESDWDEETGLHILSNVVTSNNNLEEDSTLDEDKDELVKLNYYETYQSLLEKTKSYTSIGVEILERDISDDINELQTELEEIKYLFRSTAIPTDKFKKACSELDSAITHFESALSLTIILNDCYQNNYSEGVELYADKPAAELMEALDCMKESVKLYNEAVGED